MPVQIAVIKNWNNLRVSLTVLSSSVFLLISSCGLYTGNKELFRNSADDYLKANTLDPITVPAHLNNQTVGQILTIPPTG